MELKEDPLWYKDAIIYELHVKTFFDSNGDGIGISPADLQTRLFAGTGRQHALASCRSIPPPAAMTATISPTTAMFTPPYGSWRISDAFIERRTNAGCG